MQKKQEHYESYVKIFQDGVTMYYMYFVNNRNICSSLFYLVKHLWVVGGRGCLSISVSRGLWWFVVRMIKGSNSKFVRRCMCF